MSFAPITDSINKVANAQAQTHSEIRVDERGSFGWDDAARGIESGSWAVLLAFGFLYFVFRKPLSRAFENQMNLMDSMRENLGKVTETQDKLAQNQEKFSTQIEHINSTLEKVASNDSHVAEVLTSLSDTSSDHSNAIVKILTSIESNQKSISSLVNNKVEIENRQLQQIDLLKRIDRKLEQPINVHPVPDNTFTPEHK